MKYLFKNIFRGDVIWRNFPPPFHALPTRSQISFGKRYLRTSSQDRRMELTKEMEKHLKCRKDVHLEICLVDDCMLDPHWPQPKVVIVGAGLAGLSAANRLAQCGLKQILVLEATEKAGGRIMSCCLDDVVVDLGCQGVDGSCIANPVYSLACQEGLLTLPTRRQSISPGIHMTSKGEPVSALVNKTVKHTFKQIKRDAADLFNRKTRENLSLEKFLWDRLQQELSVYPSHKRHEAASALFGMTNELRCKLGADLSQVSATQFGSLLEFPGGFNRIASGMCGILAPLLRGMPDCKIKYCKPVKQILWGQKGRPRAKVITCDGDAFDADYVIVTVSLGVLKHDREMFSPGLPVDKKDAIKALGYGDVNSVYMAYQKPFWVWGEGTLRLAWSLDELRERGDWRRGAAVLEEVLHSQQVLACSVAGPEAVCLEKMTDAQVVQDFTDLTRTFTGDPTLPYPVNAVRSAWSGSPYFRGAKSFLKTGSSVADQCVLATPVPLECGKTFPKLLFAGEATSAGFIGTTQGARLSGIREAERVLRFTQKLGGPPDMPPPQTKLIAQ